VHGQTAVLAVRSVDSLLSDARYLTGLLGKEELAKTLTNFFKEKIAKGQAGADTARPFGLYLNWPAGWAPKGFQTVPVVAFVPITDEMKFLKFLRQLNCTIEEPAGGVHPLTIPGGPKLFLRFANRHGYIGFTPASVRGKLPDPATFLPHLPRDRLLVASLRVDRIPREDTRFILNTIIKPILESGFGGTEKLPGEADRQHRERLNQTNQFLQAFKTQLVLQEIAAKLALDQKRHHLVFDLALVPRPGSTLARTFRRLGQDRSAFAGLARNAKVSLFWHLPMFTKSSGFKASDLFQSVGTIVEPKKRLLARRAVRALEGILKIDVNDYGLAFHVRDHGWTLSGGVRIKGGRKVENLLRDYIKDLPSAERRMYRLSWNHARHAGTAIHKVQIPVLPGPLAGQEAIYLAVREEAALFSLGIGASEANSLGNSDPPGLLTLKEALDSLDKPDAAPSPIVQLEGSPGWLLLLLFYLTDAQREANAAVWDRIISKGEVDVQTAGQLKKGEAAQLLKIFPREKLDKIRCRVTVEGGPALRLRIQLHTHLLRQTFLFQALAK
jgi:hypothetical protein